jgi:hypothetical protein
LDSRRHAGAVVLPGNGHVAFSPDGQLIPTQDNAFGAVIVVEVASGTILRTLGAELHGKTFTRDAAFSPDGRLLASGTYSELVRVWEWRTGRELLRKSVRSTPAAAFSPDGRWLAVGSKVWETVKWQTVAESPGSAIAWSADASALARLVKVRGRKTLEVRRAGDWSEARHLRCAPEPAKAFAWRPPGDAVAVGRPDAHSASMTC